MGWRGGMNVHGETEESVQKLILYLCYVALGTELRFSGLVLRTAFPYILR